MDLNKTCFYIVLFCSFCIRIVTKEKNGISSSHYVHKSTTRNERASEHFKSGPNKETECF